MKKVFRVTELLRNSICCALIVVLLSSCESFNFFQAQPYDRENVYEFPEQFLGRWGGSTEEDDANYSDMEYHKELFFIDKRYISYIINKEVKVVKGYWPKLVNGNEFIYPSDGNTTYAGFYSIIYDSLNKPVDTISNYLIHQNKIFGKSMDEFLEKGYQFTVTKDTIIIFKNDTLTIDLGQNAFLRKLSDSLYVFNIKNYLLGFEQDQQWWMVLLIEISENGKLVYWECNDKINGLPCKIFNRPSKYEYLYFDCHWSAPEIMLLKNEEYFIQSDHLKKIPE